MSKLVILLCLAAVVSSSFAIHCYFCTGPECHKPQDQWRNQSCDDLTSSESKKAVCLTKIITDQEVLERRCVIASIKNNKPDYPCGENPEDCEICETNFCNSATVVNGKALNCYQCKGAECEKEKHQWSQQSCGSFTIPGQNKAVCLTQMITENGKKILDRRCIMATIKDNKTIHKCWQNQEACEICEKDLCNSTTVVYGPYAWVATVISYLIAKHLL